MGGEGGGDGRVPLHSGREENDGDEEEKAGSTLRSSQAVPHPSTNRALRRLTSEVGRDPVHSTRYGRQQNLGAPRWCPQKLQASVRPLEIFQNLKFLRWEFRGL